MSLISLCFGSLVTVRVWCTFLVLPDVDGDSLQHWVGFQIWGQLHWVHSHAVLVLVHVERLGRGRLVAFKRRLLIHAQVPLEVNVFNLVTQLVRDLARHAVLPCDLVWILLNYHIFIRDFFNYFYIVISLTKVLFYFLNLVSGSCSDIDVIIRFIFIVSIWGASWFLNCLEKRLRVVIVWKTYPFTYWHFPFLLEASLF